MRASNSTVHGPVTDQFCDYTNLVIGPTAWRLWSGNKSTEG